MIGRTEEQAARDRRAWDEIAKHPAAIDKEAIRQTYGMGASLTATMDPGYHPELSRDAMRSMEAGGYPSFLGALEGRMLADMGHSILVAAMRETLRPRTKLARILTADAFAAWSGRAQSSARPLAGERMIDPDGNMEAGFACVRDEYAAAMLLAVGAPVCLERVAFVGAQTHPRVLCVREGYARENLCAADVAFRRHSLYRDTSFLALTACFGNVLRRIEGEEGSAAEFRQLLMGAAIPIAVPTDGEPPSFYFAADMAAALILADWVEERADPGIARNMRMLLGWIADYNGGPDAKEEEEAGA